jgi:hypothetical protein
VIAHVGYEPPGPRISKRVPAGTYHAVAGETLTVGFTRREPGEALCGTTAPVQPCPPGLFAAEVTCRPCVAIAAREGIEIGGAS